MNPGRPFWPGRPSRLLVIEQATALRQEMAGRLRAAYRCEVEEVADALAAMRLTQCRPAWDLVLIDLDQPGMNGFEVYFNLAAAVRAPLGVVFTTLMPAPATVRLDQGRVAPILTKPATVFALLAAVERALAADSE